MALSEVLAQPQGIDMLLAARPADFLAAGVQNVRQNAAKNYSTFGKSAEPVCLKAC